MRTKTSFNAEDISAIQPLEKMGICATVNPQGLPHMTFINSLMAQDSTKMTFGQFVRGESKWFMQQNPKIAFFILSPHTRKMWFGKAKWSHKKSDGPELDRYKQMPMQRYNSYFPINLVHYLELVETTNAIKLPIFSTLVSTVLTWMVKGRAKTGVSDRILKPLGETLFNRITSLKCLSYVGDDGFPKIIPVIQCQASDSRRLVFYAGAFKDEFVKIPAGSDVAVFCVSTTLESILTRGKFLGTRKYGKIKLGIIDIEWVYNSMPPNAGQIYPKVKLRSFLQ